MKMSKCLRHHHARKITPWRFCQSRRNFEHKKKRLQPQCWFHSLNSFMLGTTLKQVCSLLLIQAHNSHGKLGGASITTAPQVWRFWSPFPLSRHSEDQSRRTIISIDECEGAITARDAHIASGMMAMSITTTKEATTFAKRAHDKPKKTPINRSTQDYYSW